MALPASDAFTGTNGTALTTYSAAWTLNSGNFDIQSNALCANAADTECGAHRNDETFDADQYSEAVIGALAGTVSWVGVAVRCATDGSENYYGFYGAGSASQVFKVVSGTWTQIGSDFPAFSPGDVVRLEVEGTTLRAYIDGVQQGSDLTDSALSAGAAGVCGYSDATTSSLASWEGGNLGAGDVTAPSLSSASATATGATTASGSVSTDEGNGTLYWVVTTSSTAPSAAQVQAGQDATGAAAVDSGSQAVSGTGTQNVSGGFTGLTAETTYYAHFQQADAADNDSTVASSSSFTTEAASSFQAAWAAGSNVVMYG